MSIIIGLLYGHRQKAKRMGEIMVPSEPIGLEGSLEGDIGSFQRSSQIAVKLRG
jgi:hypothetical protein